MRRIRPPEKFQIWRFRNAIFNTCHRICLRKIDLEYENGKQLKVTIIKITASKENNAIHRLDVSGSTGPGALPLAKALESLIALSNEVRNALNIDSFFCILVNFYFVM